MKMRSSDIKTPLSHFFELMHARPSSRGRFGAGARYEGNRIVTCRCWAISCILHEKRTVFISGRIPVEKTKERTVR